MKKIIKRNYTFESVTCDNVGNHKEFYHKTMRNADGTPLRVRASGMLKLWKTRPNDFRLPVKYGLYESFYITHENMNDWAISYTESI